MNRLGKPTTSEPDGKGTLLDPGLDLNMKEGMAEHVKVRTLRFFIAPCFPA